MCAIRVQLFICPLSFYSLTPELEQAFLLLCTVQRSKGRDQGEVRPLTLTFCPPVKQRFLLLSFQLIFQDRHRPLQKRQSWEQENPTPAYKGSIKQ